MTGTTAGCRGWRVILPAGIVLAVAAGLPAISADAQQARSAYTAMDLEKACRWDVQTAQEEEEAQGNCASCPGLDDVPVRFCEGDLRQSIQYGTIDPDKYVWASFGEFNHANDAIEWVIVADRPVAAIQRFFIENANPETGEVDEKRRGQVLVISTIGVPGEPLSCPAGYVDARANADANELARNVATVIAPDFRCGVDEAAYHGRRGPYSGTPSVYIE